MRYPTLSLRAVVVVVATAMAAVVSARAQPASAKAESLKAEPAEPTALEACQRAAKQSLTSRGVPPLEVVFNAPVVQPGPSSDSQTLRGTGRWRSAAGLRNFNYSCNVDTRTSEAVGLVLQDTSPPAAAAPPPRPPAEPDFSQLSPAACESSAAEALLRRWPRVSQITFDRDTRSFRQDSVDKGALHGSGRALPLPGAQPTVFVFDCEIDPRDGRVLGTAISG